MLEQDTHMCDYRDCDKLIVFDSMVQGVDYDLMVYKGRPRRDEEDDRASPAFGDLVFILCRDHFYVAQAEMIANQGVDSDGLREVFGIW
jgi:hypothetical protein|tara:strand:- start:1104 stop:1370 length:267 start_codon:yes stop_codon:yes gene_type:complete